MDSNGVDVYFLNRDPMLNITDTRHVRQVFSTPPQGLTPLVPALRRILAAKRNQTYEKKLLILVATDGYDHEKRRTSFLFSNLKFFLEHQQMTMGNLILVH
jgi:Mg-chelatase subunit ChlD